MRKTRPALQLHHPFCCYAVGGVIGFALVYGGPKSVIWAGRTKSFPFLTGVVVIVASWFISPLLAGIMSYLLYTLLRLCVLRGDNSPRKAIWCLPILLLITMFVSEWHSPTWDMLQLYWLRS